MTDNDGSITPDVPGAAEDRTEALEPDSPSRQEPGLSWRWGQWSTSRRRLSIAAVLVVAVLGVSATALFIARRPAPALWSPVPVPVSGADKAAAASRCQASTNRLLAAQRSMAAIPGSGTWVVPADVVDPVVVAERRGPTTSVLLSGAGTRSVCVGSDGIGMNPTPVQALGPGVGLSMHDEGTSSTTTAGQVRIVRTLDGQVASAVSAVRIHTDDGRSLQASVGGAFFLAWWPSSSRAVSVTAYGADGTVLGSCKPTDPSSSPGYECQTP